MKIEVIKEPTYISEAESYMLIYGLVGSLGINWIRFSELDKDTQERLKKEFPDQWAHSLMYRTPQGQSGTKIVSKIYPEHGALVKDLHSGIEIIDADDLIVARAFQVFCQEGMVRKLVD